MEPKEEIEEITPGMIDAGVSAIARHDGIVPGDLVAAIYRAMVKARLLDGSDRESSQ